MSVDPWLSMRAEFPSARRWTYLAHAAVAPLPLRCQRGMQAYLDELVAHGGAHYPAVPIRVVRRARALGAELMGCPLEGVFFVSSTSQGIGVAAAGLPCGPGDNVVLVDREFPSNVRPWLHLRQRGVELRFVPQRDGRVLLDDLADAVDQRTAALSVSFVQFLSGFRLDLAPVAELCRRHDALFVLDAIQGLGVFPVDAAANGVDLLAADAHKWLLGPEGIGLGYASARAMERLEPVIQGWLSVRRPFEVFDHDQPLMPDARRFQPGSPNLAGIHGMAGSLELLAERGPQALAARLIQLTDQLAEGLRGTGWRILSPRDHDGEKSGILLCTHPRVDFDRLPALLEAHGVIASVRGGALRLSPHGYTTPDELERVVRLLGERSVF